MATVASRRAPYPGPCQPKTVFPHVGLWLSPTETLDCRRGKGVGVHSHDTPVADGERFRRTMLPKKLAGLDVAPKPPIPPTQVDPIQQMRDQIRGLETAVAHLADVTVVNAAGAAAKREEALAEAARIRKQMIA